MTSKAFFVAVNISFYLSSVLIILNNRSNLEKI